MGYKVIYSASAAKTVERLDKPNQRRIIKFVDSLETLANPRSTGKALQGGEKNWRYRVGDYRLVCEIQDETLTIWMVRLGHRREVYR